jgi:hypothetical protein
MEFAQILEVLSGVAARARDSKSDHGQCRDDNRPNDAADYPSSGFGRVEHLQKCCTCIGQPKLE